MADTPGYPDTNATMFLDPKKRLWLMWPTILANEWHTALMKYRIASGYAREGPPRWEMSEVLHVTPGDEFARAVAAEADRLLATEAGTIRRRPPTSRSEEGRRRQAHATAWLDDPRAPVRAGRHAADRAALLRRVRLLADGDLATTGAGPGRPACRWSGAGNIQPSLARRKDGTLVTYMRDNGPAPKRLMVSRSAIEGKRGARSKTAPAESRLRGRGAGAWRTGTGSSSTTIWSATATAWRCRCRKTRDDLALDPAPRTRSGDPADGAAAGPVPLSVDHPGSGRHAPRHLQLLCPQRLGHPGRAAAPAAQVDQARPFQ